MEQPSLLMAESIARSYNAGGGPEVPIHAYCCIDADQAHEDTQQATAAWLERLVEPARSEGLAVTTEVEIDANWRDAIAVAAGREPTLVAVKNMSNPRFMHLFRERSDWRLLRDCSCPVYLVKRSPRTAVRRVLAAIKHRTEKQAYTEANDAILATARNIAEGLGAELHVVTAYENEFHYPDRQKFADRCGLPRNQVRGEMGTPHDAIARVAEEIGADLVVIARVGKAGGKRDVGHTAEKLVDNLNANLLVLPLTADS